MRTKQIENEASGLMGLRNGKYTTEANGTRCIGLQNKHRELTGLGIKISLYGIIHIGSFSEGHRATGNYIRIQEAGDEIEVGSYYWN